MAKYKCFFCNKKITSEELGKRVRCKYCGSKMLYKTRGHITKVKAR